MIKILDHGYIKFVESWGSDERIIESARMSTDGGFRGWGPKHKSTCRLDDDHSCRLCDCVEPGDEKLLSFLYTHKHMTPFEMAGMIIEVQAPIMVFREWYRHRTQSYNEMSGRYVELPDMFYIPDIDRICKQSKWNKQGSGEAFSREEQEAIQKIIRSNSISAREDYEDLLERGVAREIARLVLPVNQYSRMRASANLRNWLAFLTLRMDVSAQWEIRQYANTVHDILVEKFPRTMQLFDGEKE